MNAALAAAGAKTRVRLRIEDTRLDPATCVNAFKTLAGAGASIIIGPQSSSEAATILPMLNDAGIICISQGSTSSAISLPGDNLFRFVPDDVLEAQAMVALVKADGIRTLVPGWRADAGNRGLVNSMRRLFPAAGGVMTAGIEYPTGSANFTTVAQQLSAQLQSAAGPAAIYLAAFDEVVDLFHAAAGVPGLSTVRWYGSDGVVFSVPLATDPAAAAFAIRTGYANPTLLRSDTARAKWQPLVDSVTASTGIEPDAFALAAYDAAWCALLARLLAGTGDVPTWKMYMSLAAENFFGATAWGRLNANGDRAFGDFEFWALENPNGTPQWTAVAQYESQILEVARQHVPASEQGRTGRR
jgi:branched-chain amino acid transport system substrate-binding protein